MKQILILRHAKSSWSNPGLEDFDRPLSERGIQDAPRMGKFLRKTGYKPDLVISSPAERAKQTAQLCVEAMKADQQIIKWDNDLYFESALKYIKAIQDASDNIARVMLVGHNPLVEATVTALSGGKNHSILRMPTAALVCLESYAVKWSDISYGSCQLKWMMIPRVVKEIIK